MGSKIKVLVCTIVLFTVLSGLAFAKNAAPVTADKAFDSVALQIDPLTGKSAKVAIIDLRTAAEYYWVGACAQVEMIVTKDGKEISPYLGKTVLDISKNTVKYDVMKDGKKVAQKMNVDEIKTMFKNPISVNVPYMKWDEATQAKEKNENFKKDVEKLADKYDVLILMCRSGKRSSKCEFNFDLFKSVYEIDQPNGKNGKGGFQGTSYKEVFNGYRGYPGRLTSQQKSSSVSWNDYGLPVHIGWKTEKS